MKVLLMMSVIWMIYGILGLLGIQYIPKKYRGTKVATAYKRFSGLSWFLLGFPWFLIWLVAHNHNPAPLTLLWILVVCAAPAITYSIVGERAIRKQLNKRRR